MFIINKDEAGERLKKIMEFLKIKNPRQFALSIGAQNSYFNRAINGKISLSEKYVDLLQEKYSVNPDWYKYGTGKMIENVEKTTSLMNEDRLEYKKVVKIKDTNVSIILSEINERLLRIEAHVEVYESAIAGLQSRTKQDFMEKVGGLRTAVKEVSNRRFSELATKYG